MPEPQQHPADDRELRVVDPPERDRRQRRRHDERQQHDRADERLERQVLVEQQREPQAEHELDDARDDRIEERVEEREARDRVAPQVLEILEADPYAAAADLGVGEPEPRAEAERIGEEQRAAAPPRAAGTASPSTCRLSSARESAVDWVAMRALTCPLPASGERVVRGSVTRDVPPSPACGRGLG